LISDKSTEIERPESLSALSVTSMLRRFSFFPAIPTLPLAARVPALLHGPYGRRWRQTDEEDEFVSPLGQRWIA